MYNVYKSKDPATPIEETAWGKYDKEIAERTAGDMKDEDWLTITPGDDQIAPYKVRKGDGDSFLSHCHKPVDIKIVGVFDTVGSLGYPENRFIDVSKWNKPYAFHNTDLHPGEYTIDLMANHPAQSILSRNRICFPRPRS